MRYDISPSRCLCKSRVHQQRFAGHDALNQNRERVNIYEKNSRYYGRRIRRKILAAKQKEEPKTITAIKKKKSDD